MKHRVKRYPFKNPETHHTVYLTELEEHVEPSRQEIYSAIENNLERTELDNVYANSTGWRADLKSDVISSVVKSMKQAFIEVMGEMTNDGFRTGGVIFNYNILNCWGVIYKEGDSTKEHWHFPCVMSQVYYVSVERNSSPLFFSDLDVEITPKSGMLVTFPSYLMHSVPPLEKDDQRVVIATNWLLSEENQNACFN